MVKALVASIMAVSLAIPAQAALVTLRFKLIATDFLPDGAPVDPVRGRFDLLFDNSNDIESTTAGLAVTGFNLPIVPRFSYSKFYDDIVIGNDILPGGCAVANNKDDFCFFIYPISPPAVTIFFYASSVASGYFYARNISVVSVPEPATWALMIAGFGLAGGALRRFGRQPHPA
jgi:hypothetical protein